MKVLYMEMILGDIECVQVLRENVGKKTDCWRIWLAEWAGRGELVIEIE
jgi:hypothetical protein